jgi:hypothetical protein
METVMPRKPNHRFQTLAGIALNLCVLGVTGVIFAQAFGPFLA